MTTPSKMRRLNEAAELYIEYAVVAQRLCSAITSMQGRMTFPDDWTKDFCDIVQIVLTAQEKAFKEKLMPYVQKLEELDKMIRENIPDPNKRIITPDQVQ